MKNVLGFWPRVKALHVHLLSEGELRVEFGKVTRFFHERCWKEHEHESLECIPRPTRGLSVQSVNVVKLDSCHKCSACLGLLRQGDRAVLVFTEGLERYYHLACFRRGSNTF